MKLAPSLRWINENLRCKGIEFERWAGVRRDESEKRRDTPMFDGDDYFDCIIRYPVANWTKPECFAFVKAHGEPINPLYMLGFNRVGCAPCVNSGKDDIRNWAARFPEMIDKVRRWENQVGRTFFPPLIKGREHMYIDEVVEWSKTAWGGKQKLLMFEEVDAANNTCVSKYGLCE